MREQVGQLATAVFRRETDAGSAQADDVARAVAFLLAGAHCTGSVLELHPEHIPGMLGAGVGAAK